MRLFLFKTLDFIERRLLVLFMSLLVLAVPSFALADACVTASSFGAYNGTYLNDGTENGKDRYTLSGINLCWGADGHWQFNPDSDSCVSGPNVYYYDAANTSVSQPYDVPSWTVGAGASPAGTVDPEDCGGDPDPEPIASSTSATTTVAMLGSLAFGQAILICLMFLMVVGFVWNNLTQKKPWH